MNPVSRSFGAIWRSKVPEIVRWLLIIGALVLALGAAIAPLVFLLRRTGVG